MPDRTNLVDNYLSLKIKTFQVFRLLTFAIVVWLLYLAGQIITYFENIIEAKKIVDVRGLQQTLVVSDPLIVSPAGHQDNNLLVRNKG
jgi:hypothetical protein